MRLRAPESFRTPQQQFSEEANRIRELAKEILVPAARDRLIEQACRLEGKAKLERWLSSPGLKPPQ